MLSRLEMNIDDALEQYDLVGNEVFAKHRHFHSIKAMGIIRPQYKTKNIEAALRKVIKKGAFKEETSISLSVTPLATVVPKTISASAHSSML